MPLCIRSFHDFRPTRVSRDTPLSPCNNVTNAAANFLTAAQNREEEDAYGNKNLIIKSSVVFKLWHKMRMEYFVMHRK